MIHYDLKYQELERYGFSGYNRRNHQMANHLRTEPLISQPTCFLLVHSQKSSPISLSAGAQIWNMMGEAISQGKE
jgi:hypothetical protein